MALFKGEKTYGTVWSFKQPASTGQVAPNGVTLTAGDVLLMMYQNTQGTNKCVVIASGDTVAVR